MASVASHRSRDSHTLVYDMDMEYAWYIHGISMYIIYDIYIYIIIYIYISMIISMCNMYIHVYNMWITCCILTSIVCVYIYIYDSCQYQYHWCICIYHVYYIYENMYKWLQMYAYLNMSVYVYVYIYIGICIFKSISWSMYSSMQHPDLKSNCTYLTPTERMGQDVWTLDSPAQW